MWRTVLTLCAFSLLFGCNSDNKTVDESAPFSFEHQELNGAMVTRLYNEHDMLFAVTSDGLYINNNDSWQSAGLQGYELEDVVAITEQHFIASTSAENNEGNYASLLFETYNAGEDWVEINHQFGLQGEKESIFALAYDDINARLYATGSGNLAYSEDMGISWQLAYGEWQQLGEQTTLVYNQENNEMWFGGNNAIGDATLVQLSLTDESAKVHLDESPTPSSTRAVRFAADNAQSVYLVIGETIRHSADNGDTWQTILSADDYRYYADIAIDPSNPEYLFTSSLVPTVGQPQFLTVEWSENGGANWQQYQYQGEGASTFGGVTSILLVQEQQQNVFYLGLGNGGIMRVEPQ